jgi:hypothetical protein
MAPWANCRQKPIGVVARCRAQAAMVATLTRAETFVCQLQAELAEAARCHAVAAAVFKEMTVQ